MVGIVGELGYDWTSPLSRGRPALCNGHLLQGHHSVSGPLWWKILGSYEKDDAELTQLSPPMCAIHCGRPHPMPDGSWI